MTPEPQILPCKICNNTEGNTFWVAREMMYGLKDEFDYFQCAQCRCLQIAKIPADMSRYYPVNYYSFSAGDGKKFKGIRGRFRQFRHRASVFQKGPLQKFVHWLLPVNDYNIFAGLNINCQSRILDVGCGDGRRFLYPLAQLGFENVAGCDPYLHSSISYPNGLRIHKSTLDEISGQWDLITFHHSFEHIANPLETLQQVNNLLRPGGTCVIRTPTASSYAWEHYRSHWVQLDAPRHFFLHSQESMRWMADRHGFELNNIVFDSTAFQLTGSERYASGTALTEPRKRGILNFPGRKFEKLRHNALARKLNREGRGDQAAFFLRKP